jgi:hypothetical protein
MAKNNNLFLLFIVLEVHLRLKNSGVLFLYLQKLIHICPTLKFDSIYTISHETEEF